MPALVRALIVALIAPAVLAMRPAPVATTEDRAFDREPFEEKVECLALNVYHEARSEPLKGQVAVAAVILNRVESGQFPDSVCGVVKQGTRSKGCQFSWWCDGRKDTPTEKEAWDQARRIAIRTLTGLTDDPTDGALYYHTTKVRPSWSRKFERTARIGEHLFYKPTDSDELRVSSLR